MAIARIRHPSDRRALWLASLGVRIELVRRRIGTAEHDRIGAPVALKAQRVQCRLRRMCHELLRIAFAFRQRTIGRPDATLARSADGIIDLARGARMQHRHFATAGAREVLRTVGRIRKLADRCANVTAGALRIVGRRNVCASVLYTVWSSGRFRGTRFYVDRSSVTEARLERICFDGIIG